MDQPKRARSWKRRIQPRIDLKNDAPVLYSTRGSHLLEIAEHGTVPLVRKRPALIDQLQSRSRFSW
jgi:hypothetical protein